MANDSEPSYVLACAGVFVAICPIMVALRFYTRAKQQSGFGLDDWLTIPALLMVIGSAITLIVGVRLGAFAAPTPKVDPGNRTYRLNEQLEWAFFLMIIIALGLVKLSFVFFFRRIFCVGQNNRAFNITSFAIAIIVLLWMVAFFLWFLFSCPTNFAGRWTSIMTHHTSCPTDDTSDLGLAISDVITDVMIFALPIPMVLQLSMKISRKLIVLGVFVMGSMALVASSIRLAYFVYAVQVSDGYINDPDLDSNLLVTRALYWSLLEAGLALTCCCLPTLNAFVRLPGVQSAVRSVRSALSLDSLGSRSRSRSRTRRRDSAWDGRRKSESQKGLTPRGDVEHALEPMQKSSHDATIGVPEIPENRIHVEHRIEQISTVV